MGWFSSITHPERGYEKAQEMMNLGYLQALGFMQPNTDRGDMAWNQLQPQFQKLLNPGQLQDEWIKGYEPSQYAQGQAQISREQGANALSSLGLLGSTPGAKAVASAGSDIMLRDRQQYLDDLMQKYLTGINLTHSIYNTGANTRNNAAQHAMTMGDWSGVNAANQYLAPGRMAAGLFGNMLGQGMGMGQGMGQPKVGEEGESSMWSKLLGGGLSGAATYFGGPAGGMAVNAAGLGPGGNTWSTLGRKFGG